MDGSNKPGIKADNGGVIKPEKIGDVSGMLCSANGQELGKVALQQVRHSTKNEFNLFYLTKMTKQA